MGVTLGTKATLFPSDVQKAEPCYALLEYHEALRRELQKKG